MSINQINMEASSICVMQGGDIRVVFAVEQPSNFSVIECIIGAPFYS
ncbi:hypothetical protein [Microbulbifer sp. JMSA003]